MVDIYLRSPLLRIAWTENSSTITAGCALQSVVWHTLLNQLHPAHSQVSRTQNQRKCKKARWWSLSGGPWSGAMPWSKPQKAKSGKRPARRWKSLAKRLKYWQPYFSLAANARNWLHTFSMRYLSMFSFGIPLLKFFPKNSLKAPLLNSSFLNAKIGFPENW